MGEAKQRGTFEQRKAEAIKRDAEITKKWKLAEIAKRQAMAVEEKKSQKRAMQFLAMVHGMAGTAVMPYRI